MNNTSRTVFTSNRIQVRVLVEPTPLAPTEVGEAAVAAPQALGTSNVEGVGADSASAVADNGGRKMSAERTVEATVNGSGAEAAVAADEFVVIDRNDGMAAVADATGATVEGSAEKDGKNNNGSEGRGRDGEVLVLAEGRYQDGVLVALDPARSAVLKLTLRRRGDNGNQGSTVVILLRAKDRLGIFSVGFFPLHWVKRARE